jgi:hypothetical protein
LFARALAFIQIGFEHLQNLLHLFKSVLSVCKTSCIYSNQFSVFAKALAFIQISFERLQELLQGFFFYFTITFLPL